MKLPKKIDPCPIIGAVVELRFETSLIPDAVFGVIYNSIKHDYSNNPEGLPILQLPEVVRFNDPKLIYAAHYKVEKDNFVLKIGPKVISLNITAYNGWKNFYSEMEDIITKLKELNIITKINRLGIRVTNFFSKKIIDKINFKVSLNQKEITENLLFRTEFYDNSSNFSSILQISDSVQILKNNESIEGSVIDIDVFSENSESLVDFFNNYETLLNTAHNVEKKLFFTLLEKKFLESLNPVYED